MVVAQNHPPRPITPRCETGVENSSISLLHTFDERSVVDSRSDGVYPAGFRDRWETNEVWVNLSSKP